MPEPDPLPAIKTPWDSGTPPSGVVPGEVPPIPIPDHTLIRRVGKGSYGEVWLARNVLGVYRAVKIIHRGSFDDDRPFEREFAGMQRFEPVSRSHESQLNILQVGRGPDCFYYVMELADDMGDALPARGAGFSTGESGPTGKSAFQPDTYTPRNLRSELLLRGRLPVDECIRLGLALTTALENLHRHGLVHRDIKPSNIVFVNGIPKLADIGLVALAESTMSFVGTEGYLPPEGPGTVQADLFSLGKVLYELSTGRDRQQFPELPTGVTELPDRAALAEFNEVLLRACAPDVKQRYESAAEMHADLALLQSGKSVARMRAVERRLKFVVRAGAVVTGIALLAGAAFFYQQVQTREARRLASENKALAEEKAQLADDKSKLAEENREQLVRLRIANGIRLMDEGELAGALLWFADALPLLKTIPAAESIHRIRIQQLLNQMLRLLELRTEESRIVSCAFSPDGKRAATGTTKRVHVWDTKTGEDLWSIELGGVRKLQFTPDGRRLMAASTRPGLSFPTENTVAAVFDADSGKPVFPMIFPSSEAVTDFSADGRWLVTAGSNHVVRVIDASDGSLVSELKGHTDSIMRFSFTADGSLLASASWDQTARLWRLPSGESVEQPFKHERGLFQVALSPDGQRLATGTPANDGMAFVRIWNIKTGQIVAPAIEFEGPLFALAFDGTGRRLLAGGGENFVRVLDPENGTELFPPFQTGSRVRSWSFSPDGRSIALGSDDRRTSIWSLETGKLRFPALRQNGFIESVQFSPDGSRLLTGDGEGLGRLWHLSQHQDAEAVRLDFPAREGAAIPLDQYALTTSYDRQEMAIGFMDGSVRLFKLNPLKLAHKLVPENSEGFLLHPVVDRFARHVAAVAVAGPAPVGKVGAPGQVHLWSVDGDKVQHWALSHPAKVFEAGFDRDGKHLVTICNDQQIRIWATGDGTLERTVSITGCDPQSGCWLGPDGQSAILRLADSNAYQLFEVTSGKPFGQPIGQPSQTPFNDLTFDSTGNRFATVAVDTCGRIWSARTGQLLAGPFKHGDNLESIRWSPDGRQVVTAGLSPEAKIWDTVTGEMLLSPLRIGLKPTRVADWSLTGRILFTGSGENLVRVWDAGTAEPVTPLLKHDKALVILPNRIITLSQPNLLRAVDLDETRLPFDVVADYAKLLAGRRLNASGVELPLKPAEITELYQSLRRRQPELFSAH